MSMKKPTRSGRYDNKQLDFLRKAYASMPVRDLVVLFNKRFGLNKTASQIRSTFKNHHITCGRKHKDRFIIRHRIYTDEQIQFLKGNCSNHSRREMTMFFNEIFNTSKTLGQIKGAINNRHIQSGRTGYFPKGHIPFNAGTKGLMKRNSGTFKKGNIPGNITPLGTERLSKDGYIEIKIKERNPYTGCQTRYKLKHIYIWEQANGPVPESHVVVFKDGDKSHCTLDNLILISRAELLRLNQKGWLDIPNELKLSILALTKLEVKTFSLMRR